MKPLKVVVLSACLCLVGASAAIADEVISQEGDTTVGSGFGAGTGLLVGGATGGPIGALVGAGAGWFIGSGVQSVTGQQEHAYTVRSDTGEVTTVRTPHQTFAVGQKVEMSGIRLRTATP
ncbi:hypothetical protein M2D63_017480 [Pseudomonas sp. BJa5]|uniref:hypothetical protein n=1 Tax=Pseudomonas sp. BJa5 TaxID=2936270 RepID=UPI002559C9C4|nr:hypothetical protein [Pseudomonas sp. BGr12]MDL2422911.1 hypothetical protein [Pseudomonas sp. BGr12]